MDVDRVIERVRERGAFAGPEAAAGALLAVLESLGPALDGGTRRLLAEALPEGWAVVVEDATFDPEWDREQMIRSVAEHERTHLGFGIEHTMAVCQVLAEQADGDLRHRLQSLDGGLGALFVPHATTEDGPERLPAPHERPSDRHTLSSGRPGGSHPISENPTPAGQRHSVAANDDPHADTRLSSAQGTTQERQGRTLSEGKPGKE
ncbi:MAG: DUF2267 domain-containing protein [Myxococcota bacterium]